LGGGEILGVEFALCQAPGPNINGYVKIPDGMIVNTRLLKGGHRGLNYGEYGARRATGWLGFSTDHHGDYWSEHDLKEAGFVFRDGDLDFIEFRKNACHVTYQWTLPKLRAATVDLATQVAEHAHRDAEPSVETVHVAERIRTWLCLQDGDHCTDTDWSVKELREHWVEEIDLIGLAEYLRSNIGVDQLEGFAHD
jgi:hypothetical protein